MHNNPNFRDDVKESERMTLEDKMKKFKTFRRGNCGDCGNPFWFDQGPQGWVCTTCAKTHGKNSSEEPGELV